MESIASDNLSQLLTNLNKSGFHEISIFSPAVLDKAYCGQRATRTAEDFLSTKLGKSSALTMVDVFGQTAKVHPKQGPKVNFTLLPRMTCKEVIQMMSNNKNNGCGLIDDDQRTIFDSMEELPRQGFCLFSRGRINVGFKEGVITQTASLIRYAESVLPELTKSDEWQTHKSAFAAFTEKCKKEHELTLAELNELLSLKVNQLCRPNATELFHLEIIFHRTLQGEFQDYNPMYPRLGLTTSSKENQPLLIGGFNHSIYKTGQGITARYQKSAIETHENFNSIFLCGFDLIKLVL